MPNSQGLRKSTGERVEPYDLTIIAMRVSLPVSLLVCATSVVALAPAPIRPSTVSRRDLAQDVAASFAGVLALTTGFAQPAEAGDAQYEAYLAAKAKRDALKARKNPKLEYRKPTDGTTPGLGDTDVSKLADKAGKLGTDFAPPKSDAARGDKAVKIKAKKVLKDDRASLKEVVAAPLKAPRINGREQAGDGTGELVSAEDRSKKIKARIQSGEYAAEISNK